MRQLDLMDEAVFSSHLHCCSPDSAFTCNPSTYLPHPVHSFYVYLNRPMKFSAPIVFKAQMYFSIRDAGLTVVSTKYIRQAMPGSVYRHSFLVGVQFPLPRFIKL
jgi:hypothetical protein